MNRLLLVAAAFSAIAAVLHLGCIAFGAPWYRFFGAGEQMARMAEAGDVRAALFTFGIFLVLSVWALYALSGAGLILRLPLLKLGLCAITFIYLARGVVGFALIASPIMGNSATFWFWSSLVCATIGLVHLVGVVQVWPRL